MEYAQKLGKSISRLGFGGAAVSGEGMGYGFGDISEAEAGKLLLSSWEAGINLYDFAPVYGFNLAEKRAGEAFKRMREKVFFISKSGVDWHD
ncbi:MAG: aldo/keto reductase, partial [Bacteriovoracaceae bacterium]